MFSHTNSDMHTHIPYMYMHKEKYSPVESFIYNSSLW